MSRKKYKFINVLFYIVASKAIEIGLVSPNNKIIGMIRAHCFDDWCAFKVEVTMKDADKQAEVIKAQAMEDTKREIEYRYSEIEKGPTPLGGPMRLSAPWKKNDK